MYLVLAPEPYVQDHEPTGNFGWLHVKDDPVSQHMVIQVVNAYHNRTTAPYQVDNEHLRLATMFTAISIYIDGAGWRQWKAYLRKWQAAYKVLLGQQRAKEG